MMRSPSSGTWTPPPRSRGIRHSSTVCALLDVHAGDDILDVGCGTGDDTRALAHLVGRSGRITGVDSSATMIAEARRRAAGLDLPVEYRVANAQHLPFADNT